MMSIEECERAVKRVYPNAHLFVRQIRHGVFKYVPEWAVSNGTMVAGESIKIPGVGWHETAEGAWRKAAEVVQQSKGEA